MTCIVAVLFVDFPKAFDLVDHEIFLKKMDIYKIHPTPFNWFSSYHKSRKQKVSFNNTMSGQEHTRYGVPQGSILGPLLFRLFINDLPLYTDVFTDLYADVTTLYEIDSCIKVIQNRLQKALSDLTQWSKMNGMVISIYKTKAMLVTTRQKRNRLDDSLQLFLNDMPLTAVKLEKFYVCKLMTILHGLIIFVRLLNMSTYVWLLSQIRSYLSIEHRVLFYKSYIQPNINYANIIWGNAAMNDLEIMSLSEKMFLRKAKFMFKVSNNITPDYIKAMFSKRQQPFCDGNESPFFLSISTDNVNINNPTRSL